MTPDEKMVPRVMSLAVHELRTPVTVVAGYLRMLLREQAGPLSEKQRKMLEEADKSCGRLGTIVSEMSEFGKLEGRELALARQDIELTALVEELAGGMLEGSDRGVTLQVRSTGPVTISGDRTRLTAAVKALMYSALRERGDPGVVIVECSTVADSPGWAVIAIGDESVVAGLAGIARGTPPSFDEWRGGLGLALPVARRVIEAHGGAVWSGDADGSRAASGLRLPLRP